MTLLGTLLLATLTLTAVAHVTQTVHDYATERKTSVLAWAGWYVLTLVLLSFCSWWMCGMVAQTIQQACPANDYAV